MKKYAIAAALMFAAAPGQAALVSSGVTCKATDVSPTASDCRGWYKGNLLDFGKTGPANSQSYKDQLDAMKALASLGFAWNGQTVVQNLGSISNTGGTIDFTGFLSGKTVIGVHRGNAGDRSGSSTAFFLWNNLKPTDTITLNLGGLSGSNLYLTTFSAVPEPGTWLLMIAGVGLIGWQLRRRRNTTTVRYA
jgi:hypothetical protein